MNQTETTAVKAVSDLDRGSIVASVDIEAPPERVFHALASREIVDWWVRPGVFDTREWSGDVRPGGHWRASGMSRGNPYVLEGKFIEVDPPRKLVHTWQLLGVPSVPTTTVTYVLEPIPEGTRITLTHTGFTSRDICNANCLGWETSFRRLAELFVAQQ